MVAVVDVRGAERLPGRFDDGAPARPQVQEERPIAAAEERDLEDVLLVVDVIDPAGEPVMDFATDIATDDSAAFISNLPNLTTLECHFTARRTLKYFASADCSTKESCI